MAVDYNDKRFTKVESDKKVALNEVDQMYGKMLADSDGYYDKQIQASKDYANEQKKQQQAQTDFTIDKINQQKDQAKKDYTKEQSGAYVDWQKESNQYGANAEHMASMGMSGTGYSESSQVSMYNAYQARVTAARESFNQAVLNYNNSITEARLQNNSVLAEIAYKALQDQLELSLQGFQYKNTLVMEKAKAKREVNSEYYNRWKDVLAQINTENALAEQQRQFNENKALQKEQLALEKEKFAWQKAQAAKTSSGGSGSIRKSSGGSSSKKSSRGRQSTPKISKTAASSNQVNIKNGNGNVVVDMGSVLALGYGPISAERLDQLVSSGQVVEYYENGKFKYKKGSPLDMINMK